MLSIPSEKRSHPITDQSEWPFVRSPHSQAAATQPTQLVRKQEMDAAIAGGTGSVVIAKDGTEISNRQEINFIGDGITVDVEDDEANTRANVTLRMHSYFPSGW